MVLILCSGGLLWRLSSSFGWVAAGIVAAVLWGWWWPRYVVAHVRSHMSRREQPCLRGRHSMEALPEGLHAECDITRSTVRWRGIASVAENADHIFIMLSDVQGYVVPKLRVVSGSVDVFSAEVNQYRRDQAA